MVCSVLAAIMPLGSETTYTQRSGLPGLCFFCSLLLFHRGPLSALLLLHSFLLYFFSSFSLLSSLLDGFLILSVAIVRSEHTVGISVLHI